MCIGRFKKSEDGYVLVLSLIFLPVFVGLALLIIDIGRGNNAQSDLYAAADALALAGARELDGGVDAIDRAKDAMAEISNTVSLLGGPGGVDSINLVYADVAGNEFTVIFLKDIPQYDYTPIDQAFVNANLATTGPDAAYVYVRAQSQDMTTMFLNPVRMLTETVPVAAQAVATSRSAACNVTPLYICNPFENETGGKDLQTNFSQGKLHGRLIKLHPKGSETESPGNFGFLQVQGDAGKSATSSANDLRKVFAGEPNPTCYEAGRVTTKPGAATSIRQGINVRFDIYEGALKNGASSYAPAVNVRKGYRPVDKKNAKECEWELAKPEIVEGVLLPPTTLPFPENDTMSGALGGVPGATIGSGDWDFDSYWAINHPGVTKPDIPSSFESAISPGASGPSRYDVYRYEIDNPSRLADKSVGDSTYDGESGLPICSEASKPASKTPTDDPDRRVIFAAIIDCATNAGTGGVTTYPVNSYASIFLVSPMEQNGSFVPPAKGKDGTVTEDATVDDKDATIDVEIIDITGFGGNGTLDTFVREESILVR